AKGREGTLIVVTNEVGMGIVPGTPLGRWFRDAQGEVNRRVAAAAERVILVVSGIAMQLKP
ncbi:MAG: bifunctional adenosylcobinamide kinase/adenosylcobinamide-phosphate guanylyltransferase, partial [Gemmatimonadota bacterium]